MSRRLVPSAAIAAAVLILSISVIASTQSVSTNSSPGFYTAQQAQRGKLVFTKSCANCHAIDSTIMPTKHGQPIPLVGPGFLAKWRTAGDLFSKIWSTMPLDNQGGLSKESALDAVAYLLQVNGLSAGRKDLPADVPALHTMVLDQKLVRRQTGVSDLSASGFYTEEQARRGEAYFSGNCATCHSIAPGPPTEADLAMGHQGALLGDYRPLPIATGPARWQRYPNVYALFNKIRRTMPGHDGGGLSRETYLDITAYILQLNGAPPGPHELVEGENIMKSMMLNEPGFERVFNGRDLAGLKFVVGGSCRQKEEGCHQSEPGRPFKVEDGVLICTGAPQGYWYWEKKYLNFTLRFDFRFPRPRDLSDDRDFLGNSGYFLFVTEHQVWPRMLQMEGGLGSVLAPAPLGAKAVFTQDADARRRALRPLNEWNSVEIVSKDGQITGSLNGTLVSTVTEHEFKEAGYIGFQSEGSEIHWRNIRIKAE